MIDTKHLCIGNNILQYGKEEFVWMLTKTTEGTVHVNGENPSSVEGIPLTQSIIDKCVFKYIDGEYEASFDLGSGDLYEDRTQSEMGVINCKPIKHLHALQNLWYAWAGEELTYGGE